MKTNRHYANVKTSPRLQRILAILADGEYHSTRDISLGAEVYAVGSAIIELRDPKNGYVIHRLYIPKYNGERGCHVYRLVAGTGRADE